MYVLKLRATDHHAEKFSLQVLAGFPGGENLDASFGDPVVKFRKG